MNPNLPTDQTPSAATDIVNSETRRADNETATLVTAAASAKTSCELFERGLGI
jgi:hypothetical protein